MSHPVLFRHFFARRSNQATDRINGRLKTSFILFSFEINDFRFPISRLAKPSILGGRGAFPESGEVRIFAQAADLVEPILELEPKSL